MKKAQGRSAAIEDEVDPRRYEQSRRRFIRNAAVVGAGIPMLGLVMEACGSSKPGAAQASTKTSSSASNPFGNPKYHFVLVNHVTTNTFFTPTQYGASDACNLLGCSYQWTGSQNSIVSQMVSAMNTAIASKADGIGVPIIDPKAFIAPINNALDQGIPVVSYNAEAPANSGNNALSYIGQDLFQSGVIAGQHILKYVKKGDLVGGAIATPGSLNIQPRMDGALSVLKPAGVDLVQFATGADQGPEVAAVESWYQGHQDVKFLYSVDEGSGIGVAECVKKFSLKAKGVGGSGWDVSTPTLQQVQEGNLAFSIDQQAYLQGFVSILQRFFYKVSGGLMRPADTDTGLLFVDKANVAPYLASTSRFEGSSTAEKVLTSPSKITV
jgi:simple sugar transport system substrate-binding protein